MVPIQADFSWEQTSKIGLVAPALQNSETLSAFHIVLRPLISKLQASTRFILR